jgi:hypothetical protein
MTMQFITGSKWEGEDGHVKRLQKIVRNMAER